MKIMELINNIDVSATTKVLLMNSKPIVDSKFSEKVGSLSFEFEIPEKVNIFDNIKTGAYEFESVKFDCVIKGDSEFLFEQDIKNEGEINEFGNYIDPALEGEYEISGKSLKDPNKITTAKIKFKKESKFTKVKSKVSK